MEIENLMRFTCSLHFAHMVDSPFNNRGGFFLIAGPGSLKSTIIEKTVRPFPDALGYSDLTLKQLAVLRSPIANGIYNTLAFYELEKLYARQSSVAMNLEGVLKAMVEEGFSHFAFEDKRMFVPVAHCFVMASVLDSLYRLHFSRWQDNGFLRRFLQLKYRLSLKARAKIRQAIHHGELIPLPGVFLMPTTPLRDDTSPEESRKLETILQCDDTISTPLNLLRKSLVVLKWLHRQRNGKKTVTPMELLEDLKDGLGPMGGELEL